MQQPSRHAQQIRSLQLGQLHAILKSFPTTQSYLAICKLFVKHQPLPNGNEVMSQQIESKSKERNPLTTQASTAVARSSRPWSCKQSSQRQGRQKFDNQKMGAVPP